ncbi:hypothetical protein GGTG_01079 [Gaeumannomyces tritici R3-111a-1]|uniref:Uncharacterized protein n=1 Tax=Gaeumannomyces tritici (strain R3-111a-1) TaxID=644352 RepID=J3NIK0_GAET3|nr:hypothetical protein GGTG_01079 [Gaeumannomyces tritici R3-111a-1]EJT81093.1 hypothetical protein GGTG_01079 [Gaeumannomyces tritici R3-111a-1]
MLEREKRPLAGFPHEGENPVSLLVGRCGGAAMLGFPRHRRPGVAVWLRHSRSYNTGPQPVTVRTNFHVLEQPRGGQSGAAR